MHNRQSGAAHVPIMFFLLLLVMFLGALGFAYVQQTKNGELLAKYNAAQGDLTELRQREVLVEHYIGDVGAVIAKPGKYEGRPGGIYGAATLTYGGVLNPADVKKVLDDKLQDAKLSAASGLENVLTSMVTKIHQLEQRAKDAEAARDKATTEKNEVDSKFQKATADAQAKAREFGQNLDQARSDFASNQNEKEARITQVTASLQAKQDELTTEKERAAGKEKDLGKEIAKRDMMNSALIARDALHKPAHVADGKILKAQAGVPTAFINLGRKDMLQPNTVFRIKSPGSDKVKGMATVTRVEDERAEVSLSQFVDPIGDYARDGDQIYSDLFTPGVTRTIYLMGRFSAPYNKPELKVLLTRLGNKVVDKMAPGVDTVILGNDPVNEAGDGFDSVMQSQEYQLAASLRVEFTYLANIRDLIKL
jgi:hypothetical protein